MNFIEKLSLAFEENANPLLAYPMEKYMKNKFLFLGLKAEKRRLILNQIWKENHKEVLENSRTIALALYEKDEREFHYCAIEILIKNLKKNYLLEDIILIEKLLTTHSWWDSVDSIAKNILGAYLLQFPNETQKVVSRFSNSENMWLNRTAIIYQLGYKKETNVDLLFSECIKHSKSKEFFIQKAIGWALREYGKTNPNAVKIFVSQVNLYPFSAKEALKNIT
jgi:3-methyladenine DNA glycosylase AlkD